MRDKLSIYLRQLDASDQEEREEREYYFRRLQQQGFRDDHEHRNYKSKNKTK